MFGVCDGIGVVVDTVDVDQVRVRDAGMLVLVEVLRSR